MITNIGRDIHKAAEFLRAGQLVAIPTETVYGLAGNALSESAVLSIYDVKQRPRFNPLILHVASFDAVSMYATDIPVEANILAARFSPGPISFLLNKKPIVPDLITAGSDKVVIRIPSHPMTLELLNSLDFPLAAPSANQFGYVSPVTASHVFEGLSGKIPYILDGGPSNVGVESTIVGFENGAIIIYRLGGITVEDIRKNTGKEPSLSLLHEKPDTPGQLKSHYAPSTKMVVGNVIELMAANYGKHLAVISFTQHYTGVSENFVLSPTGDLREAASKLFTVLREIDRLDIDLIIAEKFPDEGIGRAINDRLSRASS